MTGQDRNLILSEYVNQESVKDLIKKIQDINTEDSEKGEKEKNYKSLPIKLYINSYGGSVYDGFALIGAIEQSDTPVHTICLGSAMSMGLIIFVSGHKRYAHNLSTFLYHEIAGGGWGKNEEIKRHSKEYDRIQNLADNYLLSRTNLLQEKLDEVKNTLLDWYIPADEALKLGIANSVFDRKIKE